MFRHLFKLIWNKKKQNFLLLSEMLISFLVIFAVFTLMVYYYQNYKKTMGMEYENVWVVSFSNALKTNNTDSVVMFYETFRQIVKSMPQVKEMSYCSDNIPFSQNTWQSGIKHKGKEINHINTFNAEDSYKNVLNLKMMEGRWFSKEDAVSKDKPVVRYGFPMPPHWLR